MPQTLLKALEPLWWTGQLNHVLEHVARNELVTVNQTTYLECGTATDPKELESDLSTIRRSLRILKRRGFLHALDYRPENFKGKGKYPKAYWLSEEGYQYALEHFPATDPKYHGPNRSELNILHDLLRTDVRIRFYENAKKHNLLIGCKKTNLNHQIKPDDLYELSKTSSFRFPLEYERKPKDFQDMYDKLKPYVDLHGTTTIKTLFGFRYFNPIIPMRTEASRTNLLVHLAGRCNCSDQKRKSLHANSPFKLTNEAGNLTDILWFTTRDKILSDPFGHIFLTPAHPESPRSILDIIQ